MFGLALGQQFFLNLALSLVPMILSLTVHEYAHAWMAHRLGDDTAAREGRKVLSPLAHIDVFGTILVPVFSVMMAGVALIGWARPVPVRPERFHRGVTMRRGMILTAMAGPLSNLLLAVLTIGLYALLARFAPQALGPTLGISALVRTAFLVNISLFVFNLIPLPPLDGSRLLPRSMDGFVAAVSPYSFILLLIILNFGPLRMVLLETPLRFVMLALETVFQTPMGILW